VEATVDNNCKLSLDQFILSLNYNRANITTYTMLSQQYEDEHMIMQEIEIIEMDGVTTTSLSVSPASFDSSVSCHAPTSLASSASIVNHKDRLASDAMDSLLAMVAQETFTGTSITSSLPSPLQFSSNSTSSAIINNSDRTKMCSWYYEMSTFLKISPATASRSMTYLDRFMASSSPTAEKASQARGEYQLAALTTLFLSIKLFERLNIQPCHVSYLSRGRYTSEEVIVMEMELLKALQFRVTNATKLDYANQILDCVFPHQINVNDFLKSSMRDMTSLQLQLSDFYVSFSKERQSLVGFAAVINTFEVKRDKLCESDAAVFTGVFGKLMGYYDRGEVRSMVVKLRLLLDPSDATPKVDNQSPTSFTHDIFSNNITQQQYHVHEFCTNATTIAFTESVDAALNTMKDKMDFSDNLPHFLCCGSSPNHHSDLSDNVYCDAENNSMRYSHPPALENGLIHEDLRSSNSFDSAYSDESVGLNKNVLMEQQKDHQGRSATTKHSPTTTIVNMLFGMGA
jgi:hypothetical protein